MYFNKKNSSNTKTGATKKSFGHLVSKDIFRRVALFAIAGVISLSTLFALFTGGTANAASTAMTDNSPTVQAESWAYLNATTSCLKNAKNSNAAFGVFPNVQVSQSDASQGNWWLESDASVVVPRDAAASSYLHVDVDSNGQAACNDIMKAGAVLWGYGTNYQKLLCDFVPKRSDGSGCTDGTAYFNLAGSDGSISSRWQQFHDLIINKIYGGKSANADLSNAAFYPLYWSAFTSPKGCSAKPQTTGNPADFTYKNVTAIDPATGGASAAQTYVGASRETPIKVAVGNDLSGYSVYSQTCAQIAKALQDTYTDYAGWFIKNPGKKDTKLPDSLCNVPSPPAACSSDTGTGADKSCAVNGIGWIICPVVTFVSNLADQMFTWISDNFLQTNISFLNTSGSNAGTYIAWGIIRNIANVAFVIVFLIIIFSQLTGLGVANYGIKKMLPRLVIAAILVNISFFVCQLAVDLSNILGYGIKSLFDSIGASVTSQTGSLATVVTGVNGASGADLWGSLAVGVLVGAGAAAGYAALGSLIVVLLGAVVAIAMIFLILIIRQVLIILLIVVAPLAFVAFLLPNTESLFTQWRKLFTTLLLLFPIVGLIFGASALASAVLNATYGGSGNTIGQIIAAGTLVIPLFAVPFVLKKALDGVGQLGSIVGNLGNRAGKAAGQAGQKAFEGSAIGRGQALRKQGRENFRTQKFAENVQKGGLRSLLARGPGITAAQRYANRALDRSAFGATEKANAEEAAAAEATITKRLNLTADQRQALALGGQVRDGAGNIIADGKRDAVLRRAAIKLQASGSHAHVSALVNSHMTGADAQVLASSLGAAPNKPTWAGQGVLEQIAQGLDPTGGTGSIADHHIADAITKNAYSSEKIATGDNDELAEVFRVASSSGTTGRLGANARAIDGDPALKAKVSKNAPSVNDLKSLP